MGLQEDISYSSIASCAHLAPISALEKCISRDRTCWSAFRFRKMPYSEAHGRQAQPIWVEVVSTFCCCCVCVTITRGTHTFLLRIIVVLFLLLCFYVLLYPSEMHQRPNWHALLALVNVRHYQKVSEVVHTQKYVCVFISGHAHRFQWPPAERTEVIPNIFGFVF